MDLSISIELYRGAIGLRTENIGDFSRHGFACVAFVVGCMVLSGYINATQTQSFAAEICVGFITGYFADEAVGKMSEVATALFGSNSKTDPNKVDSNSNVGSNK